jgi:lysophospholipase L1-like esterase
MQQDSRTPLKIFMFGGSALWGTGARDAFTIPSIFATQLQNKGLATEVTNFGESGYVSTQEVSAMLLQLQKGQIPDLVIFYDGVKDMYSAYQQHVAGLPENEFNRVKEFNLSQPAKSKQLRRITLQDMARRLSTIHFMKGILQKAGV